MAQEKKTIFISFSSEDIGEKGYVQMVSDAIHGIGYQPDHMNNGVIDASVTQRELDERIRRSRLVIMVLDQQYKDCKNLRHEFEEVTERGNKIKVLIFIKKYHTPEEEQNQIENIFSALNIEENRYNRFEDPNDLSKKLVIQLNIWRREEEEKREEKRKKEEEEKRRIEEEKRAKARETIRRVLAVLAVLAVLVMACYFWWTAHYTTKHEPQVPPSDTIPHEGSPRDTVRPIDVKELNPTPKPEPEPKHRPELSVVVPNTFAVVCDDELFSAGICDAVSQISPTITQSLDTSKAQWTISVKHFVLDIPKMLESDALQVEVSYLVNLKNNTENGKIITKTIKKRGRSIIQNRDDAIRNANEDATKEIANILNQYKNENI